MSTYLRVSLTGLVHWGDTGHREIPSITRHYEFSLPSTSTVRRYRYRYRSAGEVADFFAVRLYSSSRRVLDYSVMLRSCSHYRFK